MSYEAFIAGKIRRPRAFGFEPVIQNGMAFDWQTEVIDWSVRRGRAALFEECGLGKTLQQLAWAENVCQHTGKNVVVHCPVGVRHQTKREAEKFNIGVPVKVVNEQSEVEDGISLVNYEKLHRIDVESFVGVVLDESSILKSFSGKIKQRLCELYSETPYRLACTATPAPNDHMELGNTAEFLGVMPSNEMLSRWFINDTMRAGGYRLKAHAASAFWEWVTTWACCVSSPSDLGHSNEGFDLPPLHVHEHVVEVTDESIPAGRLFDPGRELSATNVHKEKRRSTDDRADKVAEIVAGEPDEPWILWCDTNYEADALRSRIHGAIEVRGSDKDSVKEAKLSGFGIGQFPILITKPTVAGYGMNWQHCARVAYIGLSYSYEQYYQSVRRTWRFGQDRAVECHVITTPMESQINEAVAMKGDLHNQMKCGMADAMREAQIREIHGEMSRDEYVAETEMLLPNWMKGKPCSV